MRQIYDFLSSYKLMLILFFLLAVGAGVATFIENDFGTSSARVLVYNNLWYEIVMSLSIINLILIIYKKKLYKSKAKFLFHLSFVVMLIGAGLTRYIGYEGIIHIKEGQSSNKMISLEPYLQIYIYDENKTYYKEFNFDLTALYKQYNNFNYDIEFNNKTLNIKYTDYIYSKQGKDDMGILKLTASLNGQTKQYRLVGKRGIKGIGEEKSFKNTKVYIEYGSKELYLPFYIKLKDFVLKRYPGSMAPSSYESFVTLIDKKDNITFDYHIYMNHPLTYKNYKFFQSSYDPDESGSIFSVNNDPGKWPTYIAYMMLALGLVLNFFDKKSRFYKLTQYIQKTLSIIFFVSFVFIFQPKLQANEIVTYLKSFKQNSLESARLFSLLITQDHMGRMKPLDTLNMEIVQKLSGKSSLYGLNHNQIVLGMLTHPEIWRNIKLIKIKHPVLKKLLKVDGKYMAFSQAFENDKYLLKDLVEKANRTNPNQRGTLDREVIKIDERLNITYMVYYANLFKIFPKPNDKNNKWLNPLDAMEQLQGKNKQIVQVMISGFINNIIDQKYDDANKYIKLISQYQKTFGKAVYPNDTVIQGELLFNKLGLFPKLTVAYVSLGFILFVLSIIAVFKHNFKTKLITKIALIILAILFLAQTFGMGLRWFISGHAPWSDTYESLVYIAWSAMFAGVVFFRKSLLALSATVVMAGVFMFTAHLSGIDPQITNMVPVLKSYWLTIHVSIITGSYGFLAVGAMLGFMALILFIFRSQSNQKIDKTIKNIIAIDEAALLIGLSMLVVGNFIGGVWANESWGRYWGWDPKETWAWVSIIVYAFVTHMRLIPKLDYPFYFAVASTLAFSSILMTYFGVNFYLSGMHSYATGDPVPIPLWVYILMAIVFSVIMLAYRKKDLGKIKI